MWKSTPDYHADGRNFEINRKSKSDFCWHLIASIAMTYASSLKATVGSQAMNSLTVPVNPLSTCTITYTLEVGETAIPGEGEFIRHTQVFDAIRKASGWPAAKLNSVIHTLQILSRETIHIVFHKPEEVDAFLLKCPVLKFAGKQFIGSKPGSDNIYEKRPRYTRVKLHDVPITLNNNQILEVLSKFGTLPKRPIVIRDMYDPPYHNIANGSRTVFMEKINNRAGLPPVILIEDYPLRAYHPDQIRKYSERKKIQNEDREILEISTPDDPSIDVSGDEIINEPRTASQLQLSMDNIMDIGQLQPENDNDKIINNRSRVEQKTAEPSDEFIEVRSRKQIRKDKKKKTSSTSNHSTETEEINNTQAEKTATTDLLIPTASIDNPEKEESHIIQTGDTLIPAELPIENLTNENVNEEYHEIRNSNKRRYSSEGEYDRNKCDDQELKKVDSKQTPEKYNTEVDTDNDCEEYY